jgi:hypothetical protein
LNGPDERTGIAGGIVSVGFSILEVLKALPGFALFPLSFYLAWKKLGVSVSASFTTYHQRTVAPRIGTILLNNHKDRSLAIFAIWAVVDREVAFEVERFDPPLVLKAHESIQIETKPYSQLHLVTGPYVPSFTLKEGVDLYLVLTNGIVRCKLAGHPDLDSLSAFSEYHIAGKEVNCFNGLVYNDQATYAITYRIKDEVKTAIVDDGGYICRGWDFRFNSFLPADMKSKDTIRQALIREQFDKASQWFVVDDLRE